MINPDSLLIGIAAHTSRSERARALAARVQAQVLNIDDTRATSTHEAIVACAANHLTVLERLAELQPDRNSWCIVLEDDALPIAGFRAHAAVALAHAPQPIVGFYIGRATNTEYNEIARTDVREGGKAWLATFHLISAVAYAIRGDLLSSILDRYRDYAPEVTVERRLTDWAMEARGGACYGTPRFCFTVPSLVDHSGGESIIFPETDGEWRKAWWVGVAKNWDTSVVEYDG